jgi:hypothetical protein
MTRNLIISYCERMAECRSMGTGGEILLGKCVSNISTILSKKAVFLDWLRP